MEANPKYLDPQTLAKLQGLELRARLIVEGYVAGVHRSPYHGFSIEFAEHREYVPGDDLRYVDWKVFGKTDKFYLKQYEEETNLVGYLLLDTSESMRYQSDDAPLSKLEYAQCVAASLAYLVLQQQDSVGLATFDNEIRSLVRPSSNPSHLKQLLHVMEHTQPQRKTRTGPIFHDLAERLKRRGLVLILSDLFDDVPSMLAGLKHFRHRRHDVVVLHVARPGGARLSLPPDHAVSRAGANARRADRSRARCGRPISTSSAGSCRRCARAAAASVSTTSCSAPTNRWKLRSPAYLAARMNRIA